MEQSHTAVEALHHHHGRPQREVEADADETAHFNKIINAFRFYKTDMLARQKKMESDFATIPKEHQRLVPHFQERMKAYSEAVDVNQAFIEQICAPHRLFENSGLETGESSAGNVASAPPQDMDKVRTTLKQFVRDWSDEGSAERRVCYQPFLDELLSRYSEPVDKRHEIYVLVPGCGLARLAFEIARLGFSCQGNEFSYFMLVASNFILNRVESNRVARGIAKEIRDLLISSAVIRDQRTWGFSHFARAVMIPDVIPAEELTTSRGEFSMSAGDFIECYSDDNNYAFLEKVEIGLCKKLQALMFKLSSLSMVPIIVFSEAWSAVCTCFFIDTAADIVAYIQTIYNCLEPGGVWINLGPLLWHYADMAEPSIELSLEEVMSIVRATGFVVEKEEHGHRTPYIHNPRSMYNVSYDSVFFVCTKPMEDDEYRDNVP